MHHYAYSPGQHLDHCHSLPTHMPCCCSFPYRSLCTHVRPCLPLALVLSSKRMFSGCCQHCCTSETSAGRTATTTATAAAAAPTGQQQAAMACAMGQRRQQQRQQQRQQRWAGVLLPRGRSPLQPWQQQPGCWGVMRVHWHARSAHAHGRWAEETGAGWVGVAHAGRLLVLVVVLSFGWQGGLSNYSPRRAVVLYLMLSWGHLVGEGTGICFDVLSAAVLHPCP
jgi:hypothetical protein